MSNISYMDRLPDKILEKNPNRGIAVFWFFMAKSCLPDTQ